MKLNGAYRFVIRGCLPALVLAACGSGGGGDAGSDGGLFTSTSSTAGSSGSAGSSSTAGSSGTGATGATAGTGATGSSTGSGSGTVSETGSTGAGSGSTGSTGPLDCSGSFGDARMLFTDQDWQSQSLGITADELQMFYVQQSYGTPSEARVAARSRANRTDPFSDPVVFDEFANQCMAGSSPSIDISEDGLRLYFACPLDDYSAQGIIRVATRPDRNSHFTLGTTSLGTSALGISVSADELTLYSGPLNPVSGVDPLEYRRGSTSEPFGASEPITGLAGSAVRTPEPTRDGLGLFGALQTTNDGGAVTYRIAFSRRASASDPFPAPSLDGLPVPPPGSLDGSATISADCRTLYFVRVTTGQPNNVFSIQAASR